MIRFVQKNYGLISGVRERVADRILKSAVKDLRNGFEEGKKLGTLEYVKNPELSKNLYQRAEDKLGLAVSPELSPDINGRVYRNIKPGDPRLTPLKVRLGMKGKDRITYKRKDGTIVTLEKKDIDKLVENAEKLKSGFESGKYKHLAILGPNSGDDVFAHEAGHIGNSVEGGLITRYISNHHNTGKKYHRNLGNTKEFMSSPSLSLRELIKNGVGSRMLVREEKNASRRGIRYMKKAGYSPTEIQQARKNMRTAYNTYNSGSKFLIKTDLYKKIQTKKRHEERLKRMMEKGAE